MIPPCPYCGAPGGDAHACRRLREARARELRELQAAQAKVDAETRAKLDAIASTRPPDAAFFPELPPVEDPRDYGGDA